MSTELGRGPYICGDDLAYADFSLFLLLDNLRTLFGHEAIQNALPYDNLETYYRRLCQLPAISKRLQERPKAGCGAVGYPESLLYKYKDPSQLDFVQKAWKDASAK